MEKSNIRLTETGQKEIFCVQDILKNRTHFENLTSTQFHSTLNPFINSVSRKASKNKGKGETSPLEHGIPWFRRMNLLSFVSHYLKTTEAVNSHITSILEKIPSIYTPLLFNNLAADTEPPVKCRDIGLV